MVNQFSATSTYVSSTQILKELTQLKLQDKLDQINPSLFKALKSTTCPKIFSFLLELFVGSEVRIHQVCESSVCEDVVIEPRAATLTKVTQQAEDVLIFCDVGGCQRYWKVPSIDMRKLATHGIYLDASFNPMFADILGVPVPTYPA